MNIGDAYGAFPAQNRKWDWGIERSLENIGYVPAEQFRVDPFLPVQSVDPFDPAAGIVIPAGRFVAIGYFGGRGAATGGVVNSVSLSPFRMQITDTGNTPITLHGGKNATPAGMSTHKIFKETGQFMTDNNSSTYKRGFFAELPYVLAVNNSHGTLQSGDYVTGYWGSTTSSTPTVTIHTGKPVKWNSTKLYCQSGSASAVFSLSAAIYPGINPTVVSAFANGTHVSATTTVTWNGTTGNWQVNFTGTGSSTVTDVWYYYGQDADQIAGELLRIQSLTDMQSNNSFLKWVEGSERDSLTFPPSRLAVSRYAITPVTLETPNTVVANTVYRTVTAPAPISVYYPVVVQVSNCTVTDTNNNLNVYASGTWFVLPTNTTLDTRGYFIGLYHTINWRTGEIDLMSNIAPIASANGGNLLIQISYSYQTDLRDGAVIWGAGDLLLTDGRNIPVGGSPTSPAMTDWQGNTVYATPNTTAYGVPANFNFTDVVAAMRIMVK